MRLALSLVLTSLLSAQSPEILTDVAISVNWPTKDIVKAKYGLLPKTIYPGEVTGCNIGLKQTTFTQGSVIQAFKSQGLEAYGRTTAIAVISAAQRGQFRNRFLQWSPVVIASLDALNGFVITGVVHVGAAAAMALAGAGAITKTELSLVNGAIGQNPNLTYEADGLTSLMQLDPGACIVGTVMFSTPGKQPAGGTTPAFVVHVRKID